MDDVAAALRCSVDVVSREFERLELLIRAEQTARGVKLLPVQLLSSRRQVCP